MPGIWSRIVQVLLMTLLCCHVVDAEYRGPYYFNGAKSYEQQQQEEEQRLHEIIREDWLDLIRYLSVAGFCIFGLIGLYFHQFASYYFLKRYTSPTGTVRKMGHVLSCESMRITARSPHSSTEKGNDDKDDNSPSKGSDGPMCGYRIFVVYSASAPVRKDLCSACAPDTTTNHHSETSIESLVETDYFQWFRTNTAKPIGSEVALILLKDNPKSACTPELLNSHLTQAFTAKDCRAISLLGISLVVGVIVLMLASIFEILSMPHPETQRPIGWSILITFFFLFVIAGYVFCKMLFDHFKAKVFLSAVPAPAIKRQLSGHSAVSIVSQDPKMVASIQQHAKNIDLEGQTSPTEDEPSVTKEMNPESVESNT
jgi:hypothetical protein